MYAKIMVPIDLAHTEHLGKALRTAADLSRLYGASVVYVGVTAATPGPLGHNPAEYDQKLQAFAEKEARAHGQAVETHTVVSHDPTADLDHSLVEAVEKVGADLVVMASHIPNLADYIWPSNGGRLASHSPASVFVVRGG